MGFESLTALQENKRRISDLIWSGQPLGVGNRTRALVATEIVRASEAYGSGVDNRYTLGRTDAEAVGRFGQVRARCWRMRVRTS